MAEPRFTHLREELLRAGVAPRKARRAVFEIESHFQQLLEDETALGACESSARVKAHRLLGTNQELLAHYAERVELRAWSRRWPSICFTLMPVFIYLALGFGALWEISSLGRMMGVHLNRASVTPEAAIEINAAARVVFLWCLPMCVVAGFAHLAVRRRVPLYWPLVGGVCISSAASLCNVVVKVADGQGMGELGAGIGFSPETLPGQSLHAAILIAVSCALLSMQRRALRRRLPG